MLSFVALPIELVRTRPHAVFWAVAIAPVALWFALTSVLFTGLPGGVPELLAIGHQFPPGGSFAGPLPFWLAEAAFRLFGRIGVYALSQLCVLSALATLFALGRATVGDRHAVIAVILTTAMGIMAWPSVEFTPSLLVLPLWLLLLLHSWRVLAGGRRWLWLTIGVEIGLLLLTSYFSLALILIWAGYLVARPEGRAQFTSVEPYLGGLLAVVVLFPHLIWLDQRNVAIAMPGIADFLQHWLAIAGFIAAAHLGAALLVLLAFGFGPERRARAPVLDRGEVDVRARPFILYFALAPWLATAFAAVPVHRDVSFVLPLVALSGLAIVLLMGPRIPVVHQRLATAAWAALVALPPLIAACVVCLGPLVTGRAFDVTLPAADMGRFFAANYERRTGGPLRVVTGDDALALQTAAAAPSRPLVHRLDDASHAHFADRARLETDGGIVLWRAADTRGAVPPAIAATLPGLVPEVPQLFARTPPWLPGARIGWAVIRPKAAPQP